jgi:hypothetical protein
VAFVAHPHLEFIDHHQRPTVASSQVPASSPNSISMTLTVACIRLSHWHKMEVDKGHVWKLNSTPTLVVSTSTPRPAPSTTFSSIKSAETQHIPYHNPVPPSSSAGSLLPHTKCLPRSQATLQTF